MYNNKLRSQLKQILKSKVAKNTIYNTIKTFSNILFPLITFPYISRVLLPENVGKINFGNTYINYFSLLASLGINTYAIRECARVKKNPKDLSKLASQVFSINIITTVISFIMLFFSLIAIETFDNYKNVIVIQSIVLFFTTLGADWINIAVEDFKYITLRTIAFQVLSLLLMFCFVQDKDDYIIYTIILVVSNSGANLTNIIYRNKICKIHFTTEIDWKKHLSPVILLFVMQLAGNILCNSDITLLGLLRNDYEVGLYSSAVKIYNLINQVISSVVWVVLPHFSCYFLEKNYDRINNSLAKLLAFYFGIGLPLVVGCSVLSNDILFILGGKLYTDASTVLIILMISLFISLIGGGFLGNVILLSSGKEMQYLIITIISMFFNIIANLILIPKYGMYGAAITTLGASILMLVLLLKYKDPKIVFTNILRIILIPCLGVIVIIIIGLFMQLIISNLIVRVIMTIIFSVSCYFSILYLSKYLLVIS